MPERYSRVVLLVDDDPADEKLFGRELHKHGFPVVLTGSPEDAMAVIVAGKVGCLVADQIMSVKGEELAQLAAGVRQDMGIIMLSGAPYPREPIPASTVFVSKDDLPKLIQTVTDFMERWRTENMPR